MKKLLVLLMGITLALTGCDKNIIESNLPDYAKQYANTPRGNFEAFWNGINTNYVFFDVDPIDWDAQYNKYVGRINDKMTKAELLAVLSEMAYPLIDGHFKIIADSSDVTFSDLKNPHPAPEQMNSNVQFNIPKKYLDPGSYVNLDLINGQLDPLGRIGTIQKQLQYFSISTFGFGFNTDGRWKKVQDFIGNPPSGTKGVILDLRNSSGGSTIDANAIPGLFTDKPVPAGAMRFKPGPGRYEYGPLAPFSVAPSAKPNLLPCVILIDQSTFSCAEFTALIMSQFPQVTLMGAKTYGAMGDVEGGNFALPNGWQVQTALCAWKFTDGKYYEGKGVVPDIAVPLDTTQLAAGVDNQLEAAIKKLVP